MKAATSSEGLLALALIGAPLAIGSVHVEAQIALASLTLVAFIVVAARLHREGREVFVGWIGCALLGALAWGFLQWLPWPAALVEVLAPASFEARAAAAALSGGAAPDWMPLALDAGRTAAGVVTLLAVTMTYLVASNLRFDAGARARVALWVELSALGVLASAIVHQGLGLDAIWGVYAPHTSTAPPLVSSFVNPNHAAALMLLGALVAFGASLSPVRAQRVHLAVGVALSAGVLASMSRANALLLVVGLFSLVVPPLFIRRWSDERARLLRLLVGALCCVFVALVLIGPERWLAELGGIDAAGLTGQGVFAWVWPVGGSVLEQQPLVGIGAGSFGPASTPFLTAGQAYLAYAHNGAQQVLADLGLIAGLGVLGLFASGFVQAVARGLSRGVDALPAWAGAVALAMLGLQNLVDFSLWIPGVALPAAAVLGWVVGSAWPAREAEGRRARGWPAWRWPPWASAAALGVLVVTAAPAYRERPEAWKARATEALAEKDAARIAQIDRAALVAQHPHDHLAVALAAALADASGQAEEARRLLERSLSLWPHEPETLAAAIRERLRARDERGARALIERLDPVDPTGGASPEEARAVALVLSAPWARELADGYFGAHPRRAIAGAQALVERGRLGEADALLVWALERFPAEPRLYEALGRRRWDDAAMLSRMATSCLAEAGLGRPERARWERLGYLFEGRAQALGGRDGEAFQLFLAAAEARPEEAVAPLLEAAESAQRLGRGEWVDDALARLEALDVEGAWPRGRYHVLRSQQRERVGDTAGAIREMHEALRFLGHVPGLHERLAGLYRRAGDPEASERSTARARSLGAAP